jgi:hypothetical protein
VRVIEPKQLDFARVAQSVRENNMGIGGIRVRLEARIEGDRVVFVATGQSFPIAADSAPVSDGRQTFEVLDYDAPERTSLAPLP